MTTRTGFLGRVLGAMGVVLSGLVIFAAGCDDTDGYHHHGEELGCGQATTCGACTPLVGCGWCETPGGAGLCASDPDECANVSAFSWTWDPSGCRVAADAGVIVGVDSGISPIPIDASSGAPIDAGNGGTDAGSATIVDAAGGS